MFTIISPLNESLRQDWKWKVAKQIHEASIFYKNQNSGRLVQTTVDGVSFYTSSGVHSFGFDKKYTLGSRMRYIEDILSRYSLDELAIKLNTTVEEGNVLVYHYHNLDTLIDVNNELLEEYRS